ncbi:hypothetical protein BKA82DRAFT_4010527 [Pisolithus tinctorius]|nr:hypothetical protein BKA82DRAFT_4010527 [Pisolithus tinctorius]
MWKACHTDKEILQEVHKHIDTNQYGIGLTKLRAIRVSLGLYGTRQQDHSPESIQEAMVELRQTYPNAGTREMISLLFHEKQMSVARSVIHDYFLTYEPKLIQQHKTRRLRRHRFWAARVNDIWAVDQHDKWLRFGLALHTAVEPFSGKILWIRVWHSNRNLQLILTYFLDVVKELGHIPLVTQRDPGTENFGIANAQSMLRQWHDAKLIEQGVKEGWYDIDNMLERLVFHWLFIPWLQGELLAYKDHVMPHGVPNLIYESAGDYGAIDFKVKVDLVDIKHVQKLYITPTHLVFDLVPPAFGVHIESFYVDMGHPSVTRQNVWAIYHELCGLIQQHADALAMLNLHSICPAAKDYDDDSFPLCEGWVLLFNEDGDYYMGSVRGGLGLAVSGNEHVQQLNELDDDDPVLDDVNEGPAVVLTAFSDDEGQDDSDADCCSSQYIVHMKCEGQYTELLRTMCETPKYDLQNSQVRNAKLRSPKRKTPKSKTQNSKVQNAKLQSPKRKTPKSEV